MINGQKNILHRRAGKAAPVKNVRALVSFNGARNFINSR